MNPNTNACPNPPAAARRFAHVASTDYVPHLLDKGAARARAEGLDVKFQTADAEALPFDDASFDAALSTFGVMFAPAHDRAAGELMRVVRSAARSGSGVRGCQAADRP